ncbi:hypothetical protein ACHAWU_008770 [Discostella pseudostelligera]|uniref:Radical SAM core domain-containing protein n=1 Tax=Discostella pseudostelligera TaxID=259834 RepID=A0ABD3MZ13_9STRA
MHTSVMVTLLLFSRIAPSSSGGAIALTKRLAFINRSSFATFSPRKQCPSPPQIHPRSSTKQPIEPITLMQQTHAMVPFRINLLTLPLDELETLLTSWGFPAYRGKQIHNRIFTHGVTDIDHMVDLPQKLRTLLKEKTSIGSLHLEIEQVSKDGTRKRAYKLHDGQMIESVLMPYEDGRRTACISSQAGCAMGCVFCATGQMGFSRQLTAEEIYEQVARFAIELKSEGERLSNVVMMGMGEPLANYRNVLAAIRRMNNELGIGARKITVSTVGVVPNIKKLMNEDVQVRLALSLHCATDEERSALLPANRRYGGLDELMSTIREYIDVKKQRVTFEWALIEGKNDSKDVARALGRLLKRHGIRPDMAHVNLIPLNPTGGYGGGPSARNNVQNFVDVLQNEFGLSATPRMRRGIDIDAGCGQLKAKVKKKEESQQLLTIPENGNLPVVGVYEDEEGNDNDHEDGEEIPYIYDSIQNDDGVGMGNIRHGSVVEFSFEDGVINLDDEDEDLDFVDPTFEADDELLEAERLIALVRGSRLQHQPTDVFLVAASSDSDDPVDEPILENTVKSTTITDEEATQSAKRRRKKLIKQLKSIQKLKDMESTGTVLNQEQREKIAKENEWSRELESVEHNLM